ncbi:hypothetical protein Tco_0463099 [Tanacetum coccineum]
MNAIMILGAIASDFALGAILGQRHEETFSGLYTIASKKLMNGGGMSRLHHDKRKYVSRGSSILGFFFGPQSTKMPPELVKKSATHANVKEKFHNGMRCHKILSKFVKSLTSGALTLWGHSTPSSQGNKYIRYVAVEITFQNGFEAKALLPRMLGL